MSSAAIMATIIQKEAELKGLETTKKQVDDLYGIMDCITSKFTKAGELISEAGSIDGLPFDKGKTAESGAELQSITADIESTKGDLAARIAALQSEIQMLYAEYWRAVEEERRRAAEAAAAAERNSKRGRR